MDERERQLEELRDFLQTYTHTELAVIGFEHDNDIIVNVEEHTLTDGSKVQNLRFITD